MFLTIIIFALVLSVLIFVHELGHFMTARRLGVRADEFGFGFPPRAVGFYKNKNGKWQRVVGSKTYESLEQSADAKKIPAVGSTIYSLNWLPIGGFVKIKGENGEGENDPDSFAAKKIWKRVIILAAGVIMNILLAWVIFSIGYMMGLPQATAELGPKAIISEQLVAVIDVLPDSPAALAGLQPGDLISKINGEVVATETDVQRIIGARGGQETEIVISNNGEDKMLNVTPAANLNGAEGRAAIGVSIMAAGTVRYPFFNSIWEGVKTTIWTLKEIFVAFGNLIGSVFNGKSVAGDFAGPVGIANITGQAARLGIIYLLQLTALLSLNLAVINILPFPALDGGRIFFLIIERIKGKPVRRDVEAVIHNVGFMALIALILFITYKDIVKLF
ncbi:MAG TPA: RIP metalloprotease RseP [Candidatus Saccharimonadales bacterium]|nr:RIP metalloprotease RseP [Candidatus Saccharimonadales bacterium]